MAKTNYGYADDASYDNGNLYAQHFLVSADVFGRYIKRVEASFSDGSCIVVTRDRGKLVTAPGDWPDYMLSEAIREASTLL